MNAIQLCIYANDATFTTKKQQSEHKFTAEKMVLLTSCAKTVALKKPRPSSHP